MSTERKLYVAGFLFSPNKRSVVLIWKQRPDWQKGKLNAVGGGVERGESPDAAMRREFREEAGLDVENWQHFATLGDARDWSVWFYFAFGDVNKCRTTTDEDVAVCSTFPLPAAVIPNLHWLIPMALDAARVPFRFDIDEVDLREEACDKRQDDFMQHARDVRKLSDLDLIDAVIEEVGGDQSVSERPHWLLSELTQRFLKSTGAWGTPGGYLLDSEADTERCT
jgi:8-oxo-dGTP diphosphatase